MKLYSGLILTPLSRYLEGRARQVKYIIAAKSWKDAAHALKTTVDDAKWHGSFKQADDARTVSELLALANPNVPFIAADGPERTYVAATEEQIHVPVLIASAMGYRAFLREVRKDLGRFHRSEDELIDAFALALARGDESPPEPL